MLRNREKFVLISGGIAAILIFVFTFVVLPAFGKIRAQQRILLQSEKDLAELRTLVPEAKRLDAEVRGKVAAVQGQSSSKESPLARLTALVQSAGFPQASFSLKSGGIRDGQTFKEESFDLKIEKRTYLEILRLIERLRQGQLPVITRSIHLKTRYESSKHLDAVIRVGFLLPR